MCGFQPKKSGSEEAELEIPFGSCVFELGFKDDDTGSAAGGYRWGLPSFFDGRLFTCSAQSSLELRFTVLPAALLR